MKHYPLLYQDPAPRIPFPSARAPRPDAPRVAILLALFDGARFLNAQLESIARQTHRNWSLAIRDDGSRDHGVEIAHAFAATMPGREIKVFGGSHMGFARNFMALLQSADPDADFAAFADQDDVWQPGKLTRAVEKLAGLPSGVPALYCGRTTVTDEALNPIGQSPLFRRPPGFRNALVQNIAGGNTMVANRAALDILRIAAAYRGQIPAHDWWTYQVVTGAGGIVIYDEEPMVLYRQHGRNMIGSNRGMAARARRISALAGGQLSRWSAQNIEALTAISPLLSPANHKILDQFAELRDLSPLKRFRRFRASGLYRQTRASQTALLAAATFGRI